MGNVLWLVGRTIEAEIYAWEFMGVFTKEPDAIRCCSRQMDFYALVEVDVPAPEKQEYFPNAVYPCLRKR
jgi:hypothetical protein